MTVRKGSIVLCKTTEGWDETLFRVEAVVDGKATLRSLENYVLSARNVADLEVKYQTDNFDPGDTVRIIRRYTDSYSEADGQNELTVVQQSAGRTPTTCVENNLGMRFNILNERLYLVRPAKSFKAGDRVVVDMDLAKKYDSDGIVRYWVGNEVLTLTEDSGSRCVQTTSHVKYEDDDKGTNNVPTRWLKLYEEPAKRVVGEEIKAEDVKVGDKIKAIYATDTLLCEFTGIVKETYKLTGGISLNLGGGAFPSESDHVFILLEEAPEPVDGNLQRLLDAEIGDLAYGTYANEYWIKVGDDEWQMTVGGQIRTTDEVFRSLYKLKYGTLEIYRKVEDAN